MSDIAPLDAETLRLRLVESGAYAALDVVTVTGSTNSDLVAAAGRGAPDRTVLIAEEQQKGRGRMQRQWFSPRSYGLHLSVLLRPAVATSTLVWLPLIAGVALAETVVRTTGLKAALKWPNDLLLADRKGWAKAAGILAEGVGGTDDPAVVVGMGVNVHHRREDLPQPPDALPATSLVAAGAQVDRQEFAAALLTAFAEVDDLWRAHSGDVLSTGLLDRYQRLCATLGQHVRIDLGASQVLGTATDVDAGGRLMVRGVDGAVTPVSAGDVVHLRKA